MLSAVGMKRAASAFVLGAALCVGCAGRWTPARTYEVPTQSDQQASFAAVLDVASMRGYTLVSKDDATRQVRLQAHSNAKSFIDIEVAPGEVKLAAAGALVRGDKVHKNLSNELNSLEVDLKQRFGTGGAPAAAVSSSAPAQAVVADAAGVPQAWTEPAYDPSVWGNGNFTCLPVRVPAEHQSALTLQLTNGEKADLQLSLAYAPELCRSPVQCKQSGGCPALGIGDTDRVQRLAGRLSRGEIGGQATLLDAGRPVATIDLAHHGSIVQAISEIKH
jgi:hypothetical protein